MHLKITLFVLMGLLFVTQGMHLRTEIKNGDETKDGAVTETADAEEGGDDEGVTAKAGDGETGGDEKEEGGNELGGDEEEGDEVGSAAEEQVEANVSDEEEGVTAKVGDDKAGGEEEEEGGDEEEGDQEGGDEESVEANVGGDDEGVTAKVGHDEAGDDEEEQGGDEEEGVTANVGDEEEGDEEGGDEEEGADGEEGDEEGGDEKEGVETTIGETTGDEEGVETTVGDDEEEGAEEGGNAEDDVEANVVVDEEDGEEEDENNKCAVKKEESEQCPQEAASPININTMSVIKTSYPAIKLDNLEDKPQKIHILNDGYTVKLDFKMKDAITLMDGPLLANKFTFDHIHFHWSEKSEEGSETTIDEKPFALEMHWIFYNEKYENLEAAAVEKDGIAALNCLFGIAEEDNEVYKAIVKALADIPEKDDEAEIKDIFTPQSLIEAIGKSTYYSYEGALTIKPCSENVQWIVFATPMTISENQLTKFRALYDGNSKKVQYTPPGLMVYQSEMEDNEAFDLMGDTRDLLSKMNINI